MTIEEDAMQENLSYQSGHVTIEEDAMQENLSYQRGHVTIEEDAMQENLSYQRGHVTIEEDAMNVQKNPSYRVNRAQNVIGVDHMTTNTNIAYNTATQSPDQNNEYHYVADTENATRGNASSRIVANQKSMTFYEEIPDNQSRSSAQPPTTDQQLTMPVLTANTMCSSWQGRLEITIRVATLVVS